MKFLCFTFLAIALILPSTSQAQETKNSPRISASYLYEICKEDAEGTETVEGGHSACQAYIAGVVDYHNLLQSLGTSPSIDICVPETVSMNDLQDIVWKYLEINSHHDAFVAAPAVSLAIFEVFPCKKK